MIPEDELPRSVGVQYTTGKSREIAPERELGQSGNIAQFCMCLVVKVKSGAVKNNIA